MLTNRLVDSASRSAAEKLTQEQATSILYASLMNTLPENSALVNSPYPQAFASYGGNASIDAKSNTEGGIALKLKSKKISKNAYDQGLKSNTIAAISKGDTLCMTFWAKGKGKKDKLASFASFGIQQNKEPYDMGFSHSVDLSTDWKRYAFTAQSTENLDKDKAQLFFHYGNQKQTIELGPVFVFNLGANADAKNLKSAACTT